MGLGKALHSAFYTLSEENPWQEEKGVPGEGAARVCGTFQHADTLVADEAPPLLVQRHLLAARPRRVPGVVPATLPGREARPSQAGHVVQPLRERDGVQLHLLPHRPRLHHLRQHLGRRPAHGPRRAGKRRAVAGPPPAGDDAVGETPRRHRRHPRPPQCHRPRRHRRHPPAPPAAASAPARRHLGEGSPPTVTPVSDGGGGQWRAGAPRGKGGSANCLAGEGRPWVGDWGAGRGEAPPRLWSGGALERPSLGGSRRSPHSCPGAGAALPRAGLAEPPGAHSKCSKLRKSAQPRARASRTHSWSRRVAPRS